MNVEDLLNTKDISFIPKGKDFLVRCLNPEHEDRNPSMRVDQITGIFNLSSLLRYLDLIGVGNINTTASILFFSYFMKLSKLL